MNRTLKNRGCRNIMHDYVENQKQALCNLVDNENLRAVLRNETLPFWTLLEISLHLLANYSKTDNGQAVSILLEDGRCHAL